MESFSHAHSRNQSKGRIEQFFFLKNKGDNHKILVFLRQKQTRKLKNKIKLNFCKPENKRQNRNLKEILGKLSQTIRQKKKKISKNQKLYQI